jgi:hypothetical protein
MKHRLTVTLETIIPGSDDLYLAVRTAFTARGSSLNAWCIANKVNRQTVEKALKGVTGSRNAQLIRRQLVDELFGEVAA